MLLISAATIPTFCLSDPVILSILCFSTCIFTPSGILKLMSWLNLIEGLKYFLLKTPYNLPDNSRIFS